MDDDQTKFWGILIMVAVGVAAAVLLIDLTIKAAILDESNALKKEILNARRKSGQANSDRTDNHSDNVTGNGDSDVPLFPARVETPVVGTRSKRKTSPKAMAGTIEHSERNGNGSVATDGEQVDS